MPEHALHLIWAQSRNGTIGLDGTLPWHLPEDLAHFRERTRAQTVVMGRGTWDSLPVSARPLPGRRNLVLTRQPRWHAPGAEVVTSVEQVLTEHPGAWVIGGGQVYRAFLDHADHIVRTLVDLDGDPNGDHDRDLGRDCDGIPPGHVRAPLLDDSWMPSARHPAAGWITSRTGLRFAVEDLQRRTSR